MERLALVFAALLAGAACGTGAGPIGTGGSSSSSESSSSGGIEVNLDGGGAPATPPDGAKACPAGVCNYQTSAGCSGATPACVPELAGGTVTPACSPAGAGKTGSMCAQLSDCAAGYLCVSGLCRKLCCGGDWTGCDGPDQHCLKTLSYADSGGNAINTGAMLCYPVNKCDALQPFSCSQPGTQCLIADATGATACLTAGNGGAGEGCPCMGGFTCVLSNGNPTCVRLCAAVPGGAQPYCQPNEGVCTHYTHDPPGVGECKVPM
jgi:hypothetical protein